MGDRGGFDRGFGGRGRERGRGRGRPRGGRKEEEEKWVPCTKLGRLVQQARLTTSQFALGDVFACKFVLCAVPCRLLFFLT